MTTLLKKLIEEALNTQSIDKLFSYGYENNIDMYEIWNDENTDLIGFGINDDIYTFSYARHNT